MKGANVVWVKRVGKVMLLLGAAGALLWTGGTLALFFARTPVESRSLEAGGVSLGAPASTLVNVSGLVPGAHDEKTYTVTYTGDAPAWLGVIANVSGDLATCDSGKLQMQLADDEAPTITYRWNQPSPEVVRTGGSPEAPVAVPVNSGAMKRFRVGYTLPLDAANDCQRKAAKIQLQVVAVQSEFNTNSANNGPISWGTGSVTPPPPPPPSGLDQSNNTGPVEDQGHISSDFGQVFTTGRSGVLEKVRIGLYGVIETDVMVSIQTVVGGAPSGTVIATAIVPRTDFPPTAPGLMDAFFTTPPTVTAGTQYAIVVSPQRFLETAHSSDQYSGGHTVVWGGSNWLVDLSSDLFFETYVTSASPPPPPPLALDQSNTSGPVSDAGYPVGNFGQVFTAGLSGSLDKVGIGLVGTPPSDVTVTIRTVSGGVPTETILATTTIARAIVPPGLVNPLPLVDAIFTAPASVSAGSQYAIVVTNQPGLKLAVTPAQYAGGDYVDSSPWFAWPGWDMRFETYVR